MTTKPKPITAAELAYRKKLRFKHDTVTALPNIVSCGACQQCYLKRYGICPKETASQDVPRAMTTERVMAA